MAVDDAGVLRGRGVPLVDHGTWHGAGVVVAARYRRPRDATGAAVHGDGAEAVLRRRAGEQLVSNTYSNTQIPPK